MFSDYICPQYGPENCRISSRIPAESLPKSKTTIQWMAVFASGKNIVFRSGAVQLPLPEPVGDPLDAFGEMVTVGVEGQSQQFGGGFLGGSRLKIGVV